MANTLLSPTMILRESQRILHQNLNFVGNINRQYDDRFAKSGAKIGQTLGIRLPNEFTVRTGKSMSVQDVDEAKEDLVVATQKGVDMEFSSVDLTMTIDDFSERYIQPAASVLAANIEADALSMYKDVYQQVGTPGTALTTFKTALQARKKLNDSLAPGSQRSMLLNTNASVNLVDGLKGLFQDSTQIAKQYREGMMGRTSGFDWYENTLIPRHTVGAGSGYLVNGASQTGSTLVVDTGTGALKQGDVFTIAGVNRVHPETKADTGELQQFVVTADYAGGAGSVSISPAITVTGGRQNVTASPADNAAITIAGTASTAHGINLAFHKDAFAMATADLIKPNGVDWCAREVLDGISMRIIRQYTIADDDLPCRLDVLYGYKTVRAQLATRVADD